MDMQADRQSVRGEARGNACRWLSRKVANEGEAEPRARADHLPFNDFRALHVERERRGSERRSQQKVVIPHEPPYVIADALAHHLRAGEVFGRPGVVQEADKMRGHLLLAPFHHAAHSHEVAIARDQCPELRKRIFPARIDALDRTAKIRLEYFYDDGTDATLMH